MQVGHAPNASAETHIAHPPPAFPQRKRPGDDVWEGAKELWTAVTCPELRDLMHDVIKPKGSEDRNFALYAILVGGFWGDPITAPFLALAACEETLRAGIIKGAHAFGTKAGLAGPSSASATT